MDEEMQRSYDAAVEKLSQMDVREEDRSAVLTVLMMRNVGNRETTAKVETYEGGTEHPDTVGIDPLANRTGLSREEVGEVIEVYGGNVFLVQQPSASSKKEKMQKIALIYLTVQSLCRDERKCGTGEITDFLQEQGVYNTAMGSYLDGYSEENKALILKEQKGSTTETYYRITQPGIQRGVQLIQDIVTEER